MPKKVDISSNSGDSTLRQVVVKPTRVDASTSGLLPSNIDIWSITWRNNGTFDVDVPFPRGVIDRDKIIFANICEIKRFPGETRDLPWMGDASMEVKNIVPKDTGSVNFRVHIDFYLPLPFRMLVMIITP